MKIAALACCFRNSNADMSPRPASVPMQPAVLTGTAAFGDWTTDAPGRAPQDYGRRICRRPSRPLGQQSASCRSRRRPVRCPRFRPALRSSDFATGLNNPRAGPRGAQRRHLHCGELRRIESACCACRMARANRSATRFSPMASTSRSGSHSGRPARIRSSSISAIPVRWCDLPIRPAICMRAGPPKLIVPKIPCGGHLTGGGHWTRDVVFSPDGVEDVRLGRFAFQRGREADRV